MMLKRNWLLLSIIFIVLLGLILISGCRDSRTRVPGPGEDNVDPDITVTLVGTDIMVGGSEVDDIIKMDSDNSGILYDIELDKCSVLATGEDSQGIKKLEITLKLTFDGCQAGAFILPSEHSYPDIIYAPVESVTQEGSEGDLVSKTLNCTYDLTKENLSSAIYQWLEDHLSDSRGIYDCSELYIKGYISVNAEDFCDRARELIDCLKFRFMTSTSEVKTESGH